jgi:hypothetical protein
VSSLRFDDETVLVPVPGREELFASAFQGRLQVRYRGEDVRAETMTEVVGILARMDTDHAAKARRLQALKDAETDPTPATLSKGNGILVDVVVRGVHSRTGKVLITLPDGAKDQVDPGRLYRRLSVNERDELMAAGDAERAAQRAVPEALAPYSAGSRLEETARRWYDADRDEWVAGVDHREFRGESSRVAEEKAAEHLIAKRWPYQIQGGSIIATRPLLSVYDGGYIFRTEAEAREYLETRRTWNETAVRLRELHEKLLLDLSAYQ